MKPKIVLSGVNFTDMGPLAIFKDAITSLAAGYSDKYDIIALVHKTSMFNIPGVTLIEYPQIKSSWLRRLMFEYFQCRRISREIDAYLWFAMHDMTPSVEAKVRAVYCHNPSPFYPFRIKEAALDWKFGIFTLLYRFLYRINLKSNDFVVVQQEWMRNQFRSRYGLSKVVVAHPSMVQQNIPSIESAVTRPMGCYRFFYPAYPRTFKNIEQLLMAAKELENGGFDQFEVWLTMKGTETRYAARMFRKFSDLKTVKWLGILPRAEVVRLYGEADCLIFPSKLETWGMPITEFKLTGKPIIAANLPYAHETVGVYEKAVFFPVGNNAELARIMKGVALGGDAFDLTEELTPDYPFSKNWSELWNILLKA